MVSGWVTNVVTVVVLLALVSTFLIPKKIRHVVHSIMLLTIGLFPLLYHLGVLPFTFGEAGIVKYAVTFIVAMAAKDLIADALKIEGPMRYVVIVLGSTIVILAAIPSLFALGALTFTLPEYPSIVDNILHIIVGVTLFVTIFLKE
jgi:hypothetical protein